MIHPLADVKSKKIGADTTVWQFTVVLEGASIGNNCNINCHNFIENDVVIGNNVTVKSGVYLWDGIEISDNVFIGPGVLFTNDKFPRSKQYPASFQKTKIGNNASIGAGTTIMGGIKIGEYALIGAASLVTRDVPAHALVMGHPAVIKGWVDKKGNKLTASGSKWISIDGEEFIVENDLLKKL